VAGLFSGVVITRSEGIIGHSLVWLSKKAEEILLLSRRDRACWKARSADGVQLRKAEADTPVASWHPFRLLHQPLGSLMGSYIS